MTEWCSECHEECMPITRSDWMGDPNVINGVCSWTETVSDCCEAPIETDGEHAIWLRDREEERDEQA